MKVAVIGVGSMGKNHARIYSELPGVEFCAVADSQIQVAEKVAAAYNVRAYSDYHRLLEKEKPDAVSIAVPTALHEEAAQAAFEAGAHVLVEKPIASTREGAQHIINTAKTAKKKLMVGHVVRFNPAIQALKQRLQNGECGRIFQLLCRRVGPFPARIRDVGAVIDLAPHDLDIMRFITEQEPLRLFAEIEQRIHTDHEDLVFGLLRFPNSITAALEINWLTPVKVREIFVLGEKGLFKVDDLTQDLYFYENAQASDMLFSDLRTLKGVSEGTMIRFALQRYEPLKAEIQAFVNAVINDTPVPISGEDGLAALSLALYLIESGQQHKVIEVSNGSFSN